MLHSANGKFAIRQGDWVFIDARSGDDNGKQGEPEWFKKERGYEPDKFDAELYNLRDDPAQRHNLYGKNPAVAHRLKKLLEKYKTDGRSAPRRR